MKTWEELTRTQKILLGIFIGSILITVPESAFLLDAGGIDLILFIVMMYSQNIKMWYDLHFQVLKYPMNRNRNLCKECIAYFYIFLGDKLFRVLFGFLFGVDVYEKVTGL